MSDTQSEAAKVAGILGADGERTFVRIDGKAVEFTVAPLMGWQILGALTSIEALSEAGVVDLADGRKAFNAYRILTRGGENAFRVLAVAVTTEEDEEKIKANAGLLRRANFVELARLLGKVVKRNHDFFTQNQNEVLEAFGVTPEQLTAAKEKWASLKRLLSYLDAASRSAKSAGSLSLRLPQSSNPTSDATAPSSGAPSLPSS